MIVRNVVCLLVLLSLATTSSAGTIQLYSFETGAEGWVSSNTPVGTLQIDGDLGVTDGSNSARLANLTPGFKFDALNTGNVGPGDLNYGEFKFIASAIPNGDVRIDFDLALDFSNVTQSGKIWFAMTSNSDNPPGFEQYRTSPGGVGQFLDGSTGDSGTAADPLSLGPEAVTDGVTLVSTGTNQYHLSVPLGPRLTYGTGSSFYKIGFNTNGTWQGTLDLAIDNITVSGTGIPEPGSLTLSALVSMAVGVVVTSARAKRVA